MSLFNISFDVVGCLRLISEMRRCFIRKNEMKALTEGIDSLKKTKQVMMNEVEEEEEMNIRVRRRNAVEAWMTSVDSIDREFVEELNTDVNKGRGLRSWCSRHRKRKRNHIARLLSQVSKLEEERREIGRNLVRQVPPDPIVIVPCASTSILGVAKLLSDVRECLENDRISILGIYGMGGIGKTTLLTMVNNEVLKSRSRNFDLVVWVTVSKDVKICNIQNQIGNRIGLTFTCNDEKLRSDTLFGALSKKRFILLLDDVWQKLDFTLIGIPMPNDDNRGKIIFTTRSEQVCTDMDVQKKIKVGFLSQEDAWMLFRQKVHSNTFLSNPTIQSRAKAIARKCGGLPLALITVARAVANYTKVGEWDHALEELRNSPEEMHGIKDFMSLLKFSYDKLDKEQVKSCLLYCSLYPEDENISVHEVTTRWMGEGFLDRPHGQDYFKEYNKGLSIIRTLKAACLLESSSWGEGWVKMHDAVRDMALWITRGGPGLHNEFVIYDSSSVSALRGYGKWKNASRVSLMESGIQQLPDIDVERCPNLVTLLLYGNYRLKALPNRIFFSMPALQSLDLSKTGLTELPPSIGMLVKLRYLDLYKTKIRQIPIEFRNLTNLRRLGLASTLQLKTVPRESISHLSSLQSLELSFCGYEWGSTRLVKQNKLAVSWQSTELPKQDKCAGPGFSKATNNCWKHENATEDAMLKLKDLENLKNLQNLAINIISASQLEAILNSELLLAVIHKVSFKENDLTTSDFQLAFTKFSRLRSLHIQSCYQLQEVRFGTGQLSSIDYISLRKLGICDVLLEENKEISVLGPVGIREGTHAPLQCLRQLHIFSCNALKDVTWVSQLSFLECVHVKDCSGMKSIIVAQTEQDDSQFDSEISQCHQEPFRFLQRLYLDNLPNLLSIKSTGYLTFPTLRSLEIFGCPRLKRLPFSCNSAENIQEIRSSHEWWEELEWENDKIQSLLLPHHIAAKSPSLFPSYEETI